MIFVSSWPARPTNGSPWMSSSAPGASPTNIRSAFGIADAEDDLPAAEPVQLAARAVADVRTNVGKAAGRDGLRRRMLRLPGHTAGLPGPSPCCRSVGRRERRPLERSRHARIARDAVDAELGEQAQMLGDRAAIDHRRRGRGGATARRADCSTRSRRSPPRRSWPSAAAARRRRCETSVTWLVSTSKPAPGAVTSLATMRSTRLDASLRRAAAPRRRRSEPRIRRAPAGLRRRAAAPSSARMSRRRLETKRQRAALLDLLRRSAAGAACSRRPPRP